MSDLDTRFHETWLGMVQPVEGLVVSLPVLVEAQCMQRHPPSLMGYHVRRLEAPSVCLRPDRAKAVWLSAADALVQ